MTGRILLSFALGVAIASAAWWPAYVSARDRARELATLQTLLQATYSRDIATAVGEVTACRELAGDHTRGNR